MRKSGADCSLGQSQRSRRSGLTELRMVLPSLFKVALPLRPLLLGLQPCPRN